jgi:hypothetical protein
MKIQNEISNFNVKCIRLDFFEFRIENLKLLLENFSQNVQLLINKLTLKQTEVCSSHEKEFN